MSDPGDAAQADAQPVDEPVQQQAEQQTGQRQIQIRLSEADLQTAYANVFSTKARPEEMIIDFGLSMENPAGQQQGQPQVIFHLKQRVVMNYFSAKRLAIALSQAIRRHEEQFGEIELDVNKRRKS
jgi:hypothetical protein